METPPPVWPVHLEARYLRALAAEWRRFNQTQLKGALRPPTFELYDSTRQLGRWQRDSRTIAIARSLLHRQPWGVVAEVLRHEIAHQYAHEVLGAIDETAHGPAFRQVCARLGIDARAAGLPSPSDADTRVHRRVEKLLALAGSDNRHEAEAAMAEARRLLLVHNLGAPPHDYGWRHLGAPSGRLQPWRRQLAALLGEHFFVETIWVKSYVVAVDAWRPVLEICGTPGNVETAAWVYDWLVETSERLWRQERDLLGLSGASEHAHYLGGVVRGFSERLREGAKRCQEEGLVWVGDPGVRAFLGERHGRLRMVRYAVPRGDAATAAGLAQGRALILHRPVRGATGGTGKLLGVKGSTG